jgi:hypothetical protein
MKKYLFGLISLLIFPEIAQLSESQKPAYQPGFFTKLKAAPAIVKSIWNESSKKSAGQALATYYSARMLGILGHELGHSITATALTGKLSPVFIGAPRPGIPILPFPGPVFISGIRFTGGSVLLTPETAEEVPRFMRKMIATVPEIGPRNFLITAAGPAAGIATSFALLKAPYIYAEYQKTKDIKHSCQIGLQKPLAWQDISLALVAASFLGLKQNIMNLVPYHERIDAYKMLEAINASAKTINAAKFGMMGVYAASNIYLAKKFYDICYEKYGKEIPVVEKKLQANPI